MKTSKRARGATDTRERGTLTSVLGQIDLRKRYLLTGAAALVCLALGLSQRPDAMLQPAPHALDPTTTHHQQATGTAAHPDHQQAATEPPEPQWNSQTVRRGDNLSLIFKRAGFSDREVYLVTRAPDGKGLAHIFPGQSIGFQADDAGNLVAVRHVKSPLETVTYRLVDGGFTSEVATRKPEVRRTTAAGVITSSLYMAGKDAGLSNTTIMDMANIFGGVIDFVGDPRKGDTMELVFESEYLDGKKFADGAIIAASYTNQGKTYTAYRYTDSAGDVGYYNEDGVSMRRAFLLAPVDFTRISSNFNMKRLHPVLGTLRPHRGTDYAAPTGTPIYAAGDGRVVKSAYSRANGNYVFIQHGEQFETKYLHMHKRNVKVGDRVTQGQVIGTVGATGLATGPHLHYEFLMNGVHRNPRTIHKYLPKAKSLPADELPAFRASIAGPSQQLAQLRDHSATQVAMHGAGNDHG